MIFFLNSFTSIKTTKKNNPIAYEVLILKDTTKTNMNAVKNVDHKNWVPRARSDMINSCLLCCSSLCKQYFSRQQKAITNRTAVENKTEIVLAVFVVYGPLRGVINLFLTLQKCTFFFANWFGISYHVSLNKNVH